MIIVAAAAYSIFTFVIGVVVGDMHAKKQMTSADTLIIRGYSKI